MYRGTSKLFKVVYSPEKQYAIWHADAPSWPTWNETGRYGTEIECWDYIEAREGIQGYILQLPNSY
jgi:uncharacterized protein YbdZ (MbtH family)